MQLHNHEQKVNTKQNIVQNIWAYFRNNVNTLNYSNATNRNEHTFQLLFVPLESIILVTFLQGTGQNGNYFRIPGEKFSNLEKRYPDRTFPLSNLINTTFNLIVLGKCRTIIINSIEL